MSNGEEDYMNREKKRQQSAPTKLLLNSVRLLGSNEIQFTFLGEKSRLNFYYIGSSRINKISLTK